MMLFFCNVRAQIGRVARLAMPRIKADLRVIETKTQQGLLWSGREDSNLRPLPPEGSALPG